MSLDDVLKLANSPGALLAFVLLLLIAGGRGAWVFGRTYDQLIAERNEWKEAALAAIRNSERLLEKFERDPRRLERVEEG